MPMIIELGLMILLVRTEGEKYSLHEIFSASIHTSEGLLLYFTMLLCTPSKSFRDLTIVNHPFSEALCSQVQVVLCCSL